MPNTPDWSLGDSYLREHAPELIPLIDKFSPCTLVPETEERYFTTLVTGIISQQLPPKVSVELLKKLNDILGTPLTPEAVLATTDEVFYKQGLVPQKVEYLKTFAKAVIYKSITMNNFSDMTDNEISKQLLQVRGLGQWTIEMFLLLALCRTDIVPSADFIFKKELKELLNLNEIPKRGKIMQLTEHWRPWRSLAVWYLWQTAACKEQS